MYACGVPWCMHMYVRIFGVPWLSSFAAEDKGIGIFTFLHADLPVSYLFKISD